MSTRLYQRFQHKPIDLFIPMGKLATQRSDDDAAAARRREIAERLRNGHTVQVGASGQVINPNDRNAPAPTAEIPKGILATQRSDDDAAAARRREIIAELLRNGQTVQVTASGQIVNSSDPNAPTPAAKIPKGLIST